MARARLPSLTLTTAAISALAIALWLFSRYRGWIPVWWAYLTGDYIVVE